MNKLILIGVWGLSVGSSLICFSENQVKKGQTTLYNPLGKRDPFKEVTSNQDSRKPSSIYPTESYDLDQLVLKAILRMSGKSRAVLEAPDGKTFVVFEGDVVGRERATLSRILKSEIIFTQKTFNYLGSGSLIERVVSLPAEDSTETRLISSEKTKGTKQGQETKGNATGTSMSPSEAVKAVSERPKQIEQQIDKVMQGK